LFPVINQKSPEWKNLNIENYQKFRTAHRIALILFPSNKLAVLVGSQEVSKFGRLKCHDNNTEFWENQSMSVSGTIFSAITGSDFLFRLFRLNIVCNTDDL
jgi:hypothetical protein